MSDATEPPAKQPYSTPTLVTYGDLVSLTQGRLLGGKRDGGKALKSRTR